MAAMRSILRLRPGVHFYSRPFCVSTSPAISADIGINIPLPSDIGINIPLPSQVAVEGITEKKAWSDTRTAYQTSAMTDFVKDYRELSRLAIWDDLLEDVDPDFRVLDVCSGTGRFSQAFHELVLRPRNLKVVQDYTDLCSHSLEVLRERMAELGEIPNNVFVGDCSKLNSLIDEPYNLIVNMHGLYGLPEKSLAAALQSMYEALKPGGHMVLSIGTSDSLYQRVPLFLYRNGYISSPYTNNKDIFMHLAELGIDYTIENIVYYENFSVDDKEGLRRFIMDECGGNTFSVEDASAQSMDLSSSWEAMEPLIRLYLDPQENMYRFKQEVAVFKIERTIEVLPPMLPKSDFYADAYKLHMEASSMQSNLINWGELQSDIGHDIKVGSQRALVSCKVTVESLRGNRNCHILYDFDGDIPEKVAALRRAIQMAGPQGRVVVIHRAKGMAELQQSLLPLMRDSTMDMFSVGDIENILNNDLKDDIAGFVRHEIDAYLDLSEIIKGSPTGIKLMSYCLETDLRAASDAMLQRSIAAFRQRSVETAEPGRKGGPFMADPVVCFVIEPQK